MGVFAEAFVGSSHWVVVVRRGDESTFEYLRSRLAGVRGVEVTLDRRAAADDAAATERRRERARFNALGVLVVRRPRAPLLIR